MATLGRKDKDTFTISFAGIDKVHKDFQAYLKVEPRAVSSAMNSAMSRGATASLRKANLQWGGLPTAAFKRRTWRTKASVANTKHKFVVTSGSINLMDFTTKKSYKKGLSYKLKGRKQRQMKGSFTKKGYFFKRQEHLPKVTNKAGNKVEAIRPYFSITPTSMFRIADGFERFAYNYNNGFEERFFQQVDRFLGSSK